MKYFSNKYIYGFITFILMYIVISISIKPTFNLVINSNIKSELQVFYKTINGSYSEKYVHNRNIVVGQNSINLKLRTFSDQIRIDVSNSAFNVKINSISLNYLFYKIPLNINKEQVYQLDSIIENEDKSIDIVTIKNASDPQILFLVSDKFKNYIYLINLIVTFFIFIFLMYIKLNFAKAKNIILNLEKALINFYEYIVILNIDFSKFYIYFIIGFVFHIFEISNFLISVDDEYSAFRITPEAWIWDGRWTGFLIEKFIFEQPTMPFVPNIISCGLMTLSYIILLKTHKINSSFKTYLVFPIFSAFPTLWMINEFYGNMVMVSFGFLMVSVAMLIFVEFEKYLSQNKFSIFETIKILFLPSLILAIAIGTYQSFLMLSLSFVLGVFFLRLSKNQTDSKMKYVVNAFFYIVLGLILYLSINTFFKTIYPSDYNYIGGFIKVNNFDLVTAMKFVYYEMIKVYSGSPDFFGTSIGSLGILILFVFFNAIFNQNNRILSTVLLISILISPFLLHFLSGGNLLPSRSMVAIPYVIWLFAILTITSTRYIKNIIGILIVSFLLIQQLSALGQYAAVTRIIQSQDQALASDLYQRMSDANSNFNPKDIHYVDIYGYRTIETIYPTVPTSTMNASFFDWDAGNMSRMISFMKLIGYSNISMVTKEAIEKNSSYFDKMPVYPNKESVQYINGMYLIKLGDKPDVYRRK